MYKAEENVKEYFHKLVRFISILKTVCIFIEIFQKFMKSLSE